MRKILLIFTLFVIYLFLFTQVVLAQVVINEFSPATDIEWVELYNKNSSQKSLQGYSIFFDSNASTTQKFQFCDSDKIDGNSFRLINITSHYLNNAGDTIILKIGDDLVDSIAYGSGQTLKAPSSAQSAARDSDGGGSWIINNTPSPTGEIVVFNCPTPTVLPTVSPTPTPSLSKATYEINIPKDDTGAELTGVQIYVDGQYVHHQDNEILEFYLGNECYSGVSCNFGIHTVSLRKSGYSNWEETKDFQAGINLNANPVLNKQNVATSTPSPSPLSTKTPTPKPTPTILPTDSPEPEILGEATTSSTFFTSDPTSTPKPETVNKPPILGFVLMGVGILFIGVAGYLVFTKS